MITIRQFPGTLVVVLVTLLSVTGTLTAQSVDYSIANEFRYGIGEQYEDGNVQTKEYLEDLFNTRIYIGDFRLGFRAQLDRPREYGVDTVGITQYYAEFSRDGVNARAGTFYELVGRGLVFNTFESRPIGFNTQSEGVNLKYRSEDFSAGAFGGLLNYPDLLRPNERTEDYLVRSGWAEARPLDGLTLGGSFLAATGLKTRQGFRNEFDAYLREGYLGYQFSGAELYVNLADKRSSIDSLTRAFSSSTNYGAGVYSKLSYTGSLFGAIAEYKNYRFDVVEPPDRDVSSRPTRALPFQNPPTLIPEHDKTLLARNPHAPDPSDELGFQFTGLLYPTFDLSVTLIASAGSRHRAYEPYRLQDTNGVPYTEYRRVRNDPLGLNAGLPVLDDLRFSPYWELFGQVDYDLSDDVSLGAAVQRKDNRIWYVGNGAESPGHSEIYTTTTGVVESIVDLGNRDAVHGIVEFQRVFDSKKSVEGNDSLGLEESDGRYLNTLLTLEYSSSPKWTLSTRWEISTAKNEQEGRHIWPVVAGTYRIGRSHTFGAQYGWERGGVVCTGGVCRFINPFTGFRLWLTTKI